MARVRDRSHLRVRARASVKDRVLVSGIIRLGLG